MKIPTSLLKSVCASVLLTAAALGTSSLAADVTNVLGRTGFEEATAGQNSFAGSVTELSFSTLYITNGGTAGANDRLGQVASTALTGNDAGSTASLLAAFNNKTGSKYFVTANHTITRQVIVTFGSVNITGYTNRTVSLRVFHANTSWETGDAVAQDLLKAVLTFSDTTTQTIIDTTTGPNAGDIDNQTIGLIRENYATLTFAIPDGVTATSVILKLTTTGNSSQAAESFAYDEIIFAGVSTAGTPAVTLTAPANGSSAFAPATVNLTSTASGGSGSVSNVAYFYTNSGAVTIVGTSASGPTYPVSTAPLAVGSYGFYAVTTNTSGATAFSGTNVVTVVPPLASLTFLQQPSEQLVGAVIAPEVQVGATNSLGAAMTGIPVSLSLTGGGTLGGTVTQNTDGSGVAHFANLTVSTVGSKTLIATNSGSLIGRTSASFSITNSPPIFVGTTGSGTNSFAALPAVTQWSTFNIQGAHNATRTDGDWDTCMTTNGAANINLPLTSKADNGNLATAYWRSDVLRIETRPTNPTGGSGAATLLMATLNNSSGATINSLNVAYLMSDSVVTTEDRKGHRAYYSTTGATNSWTAIGNFNIADNSTNNIAFALTSLGWAANTSMYIVWLDEDGLSPDGDYGIDDISFTPPGGGPTPPQYLAITQSGANKIISWTNASAVLQQTTNLLTSGTAWSTVPGATSPFTNSVTSGQRLYRLLVP